MARQLRIEFPGAVYHVTSRGNARQSVYADDGDRDAFLQILASVILRFRWRCHAYCLMDNHYHLLLETPEANLSQGMRQLNGVYTQAFNKRHDRVGHIFQGRFKSILVDKDSYLLTLCRYIVQNPVAARLVTMPAEWRWSSYLATAGLVATPQWLHIDWILRQFSESRNMARSRYREFVDCGTTDDSPWDNLVGRVFLGREEFAESLEPLLQERIQQAEIPKQQRLAFKPALQDVLAEFASLDRPARQRLIFRVHCDLGYTMKEIAGYLGVHYA
ncbi:MAG: transposase, partial [Desulfuromonadales bacterium]|nr:transposase [Desulfuromonadales bacterium]